MKKRTLALTAMAGAILLPLPALAHTDFSFNLYGPGYVETPPAVVYQAVPGYYPSYQYYAPGYQYYSPGYSYYGDDAATRAWRAREWRERHWGDDND